MYKCYVEKRLKIKIRKLVSMLILYKKRLDINIFLFTENVKSAL